MSESTTRTLTQCGYENGEVLMRLGRGQNVFHQGDKATSWYEIVSGTIKTSHVQADGQRQLTGFFFSGDVFGLAKGRYDCSAEAIEDARILRHLKQQAELEGSSPLENVHLERALGAARQFIALLGRRTANERLAAFIMLLAERQGSKTHISVPMSRADIADHLGLTIHTISRTFSDLAKTGLIELGGRSSITLCNFEALSELAGGSEVGSSGRKDRR